MREPWKGETAGVAGVTINLYQGTALVGTTHTVAGGWYGFAELPLGTYRVNEVQPEGYASTSVDSLSVNIAVCLRYIDNNFGEQAFTPTPTPTWTPTDMPSATPTVTPTAAPTDTPTVTPTWTPTDIPTDTPTPLVEPTATPTNTPTPVWAEQAYQPRQSKDEAYNRANWCTVGSAKFGITANEKLTAGFRFTGLNKPADMVVQSAYLEWTANSASASSLNVRLYAQKAATTSPFDCVGNKPSSRVKTATSITYTAPVWLPNGTYESPDLSVMLNEVLAAAGEAWDGSFVVLIAHESGSGIRDPKVLDFAPAEATVLHIVWATTQAPSPLVDTYFVAASADDAHSRESYCTTGSVRLGGTGNEDITAGLRFQNVQKREGRALVKAQLEFTSQQNATGALHLQIAGADEDNAVPFGCTSDAGKPHLRPATQAMIAWSPKAWVEGMTYRTPNVAEVVQGVLDRSGWVNGNALGLLVQNDGSSANALARYYEMGMPTIKLVLTWR